MQYDKIVKGIFRERPNRFIALVEIEGSLETVHVKNTGRCRELLVPGVTVYLEEGSNPARKTKYSLVCVQKGNRLINMDSQAPNKVVAEWLAEGKLFPNASLIRPETKYNASRFDFYVEQGQKKIFMEVKGVTLEQDGVVLFPDAPTERGLKHIRELCQAVGEGYEACIFLVVQMKNVKYFTPNMETHPEFGEALARAQQKGVKILAYDCMVTRDSLQIMDPVKIRIPDMEWSKEKPEGK